MGKYMRKAKVTGGETSMEVAQSTIGVLTRAKTLALRLQKKQTTTTTAVAAETTTSNNNSATNDDNKGGAGSYFQLRSRKLEKPILVVSSSAAKKHEVKESCKKSPNSKLRTSPRLTMASVNCDEESRDEASFGENFLEIEGRDRGTRESTPCSLIRNSEILSTPGSTTRTTNSTARNQRIQNPMRGNIPTTREVEEFFAVAEQEQQRTFIERYNFDPVNDSPLPGRYEWERLDV
ncbi:hypothetical protein MKW94_016770 [Papaver nudicaule]|uniref:Cyclin-dependent kinase inhibitor domain-containing protein n=1 Tax=Papaver nudicaule TaxID=74823 RepID=A0AA42B156_PAPNU|nr:hypothetical protein [Papaver nudicaule]MCL7049499.1 hypothetical protein [Papaver nudicaule]